MGYGCVCYGGLSDGVVEVVWMDDYENGFLNDYMKLEEVVNYMRVEEVMVGGIVVVLVFFWGRYDILGEKGYSVEEVEGVVVVVDSYVYDEYYSCMLEVEDSCEEVLEVWVGSGS